MAHDVFISHSSKDKAAGDLVYATLEAGGIRCWIASRDIPPGADRETEIAKAIAGSKLMVVVAPSNGSGPANEEVDLAVTIGLPVIPVRGVVLKEAGGPNAPLDTLLKTVCEVLGKDSEVKPAVRPAFLRVVPAAPGDGLVRVLRGYLNRPGLVIAAICAVGVLFIAWQLEMGDQESSDSNNPSGVIDHPSPDTPRRTVANPRSSGKAHVCLEDYPPDSVRFGEQGTTTMTFTIRADGTTGGIQVVKSSGYPRLDAAAVRCASSWLYKPATRDGAAVAVPWKAEVKWQLH